MNGARPHQYGVAKKTSEAPRAGMEQGVGGKKRRSYPKILWITVSRAIPPSLEGRGLPRTGSNKTKTASTPEGTLAVVFDLSINAIALSCYRFVSYLPRDGWRRKQRGQPGKRWQAPTQPVTQQPFSSPFVALRLIPTNPSTTKTPNSSKIVTCPVPPDLVVYGPSDNCRNHTCSGEVAGDFGDPFALIPI